MKKLVIIESANELIDLARVSVMGDPTPTLPSTAGLKFNEAMTTVALVNAPGFQLVADVDEVIIALAKVAGLHASRGD